MTGRSGFENPKMAQRREAAAQAYAKRAKHVRRMNALFWTLMGLTALSGLTAMVGIGFVIFHFVAKWW